MTKSCKICVIGSVQLAQDICVRVYKVWYDLEAQKLICSVQVHKSNDKRIQQQNKGVGNVDLPSH
jgi:hypothetical protein